MADWQKLAIRAILADGKIDDAEVKILQKELYADGVIDTSEVKFLINLRNEAKGNVTPAFTKFFFKAVKDNLLKDGAIDAAEAKWLRSMLYADGKIDEDEKKFLKELKRAAKKTSSAFDKLYTECVGG
jgi:uncharacterized tellurite resistance protein B-like protein